MLGSSLVLLAATALLGQVPAAPERSRTPPSYGRGTPDLPHQGEGARLLREMAEHSQAYTNLEELCDDIGPRVTGSERLRRAQAWAAERLKAYGAVKIHEEPYDFGRSWSRGQERARLLTGNGVELHVAQQAWTPATGGPIRGPVALLQAQTLDELRAAVPGLTGRIVLQVGLPRPSEGERKDRMKFIQEVGQVLAGGKFKALLRDAAKKDDEMSMTGSPAPRGGPSTIPTAFISSEHANLIKRLALRGRSPEIELELGGTTSKEPVQAANLVAELPGTEKAEEIVIIGGHLDSWDLGTGATDNGTGCVAALEVLRAIQALGLKPKRTLRVVLFSGEEQGLLGSIAYVKAHEAELPRIQAVLIDDGGTGKIKGWPDMGQEQWREPLAVALVPANQIGGTEIGDLTVGAGTDHWPFHQKGVPAFAALQEELDYETKTHHSQSDVLDHVVKEDLLQGAQVLAVTAWGLLNGERLPHRAVPSTK